MKFDMPAPDSLLDEGGALTREWVKFMGMLLNNSVWRSQAGTTAQRPTTGLEIGTPYWDSTLQKPIWCSQVKPAIVWKDAAAVVV